MTCKTDMECLYLAPLAKRSDDDGAFMTHVIDCICLISTPSSLDTHRPRSMEVEKTTLAERGAI